MDKKLVKTSINIAGRIFPLMLTSYEASKVADIEKKINSDIQLFQQQYPDKDTVDWLSMTLVKLSFETHEISSSSTTDKIMRLHEVLSNAVD